MTIQENTAELEQIRLQLWRLRRRNKKSKWFCSGIMAIEELTKTMIKVLNHVANVSK